MLDMGDLLVFTKVVETESLTKAGRLLGLPKSTISRRLTRLEEHLGAQLLYRSTRAVTVTQHGELFFEYCLRSMGVLRDGERALQSQQRNPQGVVRIAIPYLLGQTLTGPLQLRGKGTIEGSHIKFSGFATAEREMQPALNGLLGLLGMRSGDKVLLAIDT